MRSFLAFLTLFLSLSPYAFSQSLSRKDSISEIRKHIMYLASEPLQGRLSGSDEANKAAEYITNEFKACGLTPFGDNNTWYQPFPFIASVDLTTRVLRWTNTRIDSQDIDVLGVSANGGASYLRQVAAGKGIVTDKINDFKGVDCKGKAVWINLDLPDSIKPHSAEMAACGVNERLLAAKNAGASLVIFYKTKEETEVPSFTSPKKEIDRILPCFYVRVKPSQDLLKQLVDFDVSWTIKRLTAKNVLGFIDNKASTTIIIGAHYDHLGYGELGGSLNTGERDIHHGADDNASGTAGLFFLAKSLRALKSATSNFLFIAFSGEELGLLGSSWYTKHPKIDMKTISCMINMDMIGRLNTDTRVIGIHGTGTSPSWDQLIDTSGLFGLRIKKTLSGTGSSDHSSFYLKDIPVLHFFSGTHKDYHKPSDTYDKINYNGELDILNYIHQLILKIEKKSKLEFTPTIDTDNSPKQFKVTLGIIPDYLYEKMGVRVEGVNKGRPGHQAGMLAGDIIISMDGEIVQDMQSYMRVLSRLRKNDQISLKVMRGDQMIDLTVKF
jgi:hypothetical protein